MPEIKVYLVPPKPPEDKWKAYSPAFPSCIAWGDTKQKAFEEFQKMLNKFLDSLEKFVKEFKL